MALAPTVGGMEPLRSIRAEDKSTAQALLVVNDKARRSNMGALGIARQRTDTLHCLGRRTNSIIARCIVPLFIQWTPNIL